MLYAKRQTTLLRDIFLIFAFFDSIFALENCSLTMVLYPLLQIFFCFVLYLLNFSSAHAHSI